MKVLYLPGQLSKWSDKMTLEGAILLIKALIKQAFSTGTLSARPSWEINSFGKKFYLNGREREGTSQKLTWIKKKRKMSGSHGKAILDLALGAFVFWRALLVWLDSELITTVRWQLFTVSLNLQARFSVSQLCFLPKNSCQHLLTSLLKSSTSN